MESYQLFSHPFTNFANFLTNMGSRNLQAIFWLANGCQYFGQAKDDMNQTGP
jgi:hypothetical protein